MAVLGELPLADGSIKVDGQVAYVSQQPWVFSASVRQNITFGEDFDEEIYKTVIKAAALARVRYIMWFIPRSLTISQFLNPFLCHSLY